MSVIRIVSHIAVTSVAQAQTFYVDLCNLDVVMDIGWIMTLASGNAAPAHISLATAGGSGTAVPDLSMTSMLCIGARRFYVNDPSGKRLNIRSHSK